MTSKALITPDRWLVCSPDVMQALDGRWRRRCASKLLDLRLKHHVQQVTPAMLPSRIDELLAAGWRRVRVVLSGGSEVELDAIEALTPHAAQRVRLHDYRAQPHAAISTLCAPEDAVISAWQVGREAGNDNFVAFIDGPGIDDEWRQEYALAFEEWKQAARAADPEGFEEMYPEPGARQQPSMEGTLTQVAALWDRVEPWAAGGTEPSDEPDLAMEFDFEDGAGAELSVRLGSEAGRESEVVLLVPVHKARPRARLEVWLKGAEGAPLFTLEALTWQPGPRGTSYARDYPLTTEAMYQALIGPQAPQLRLRLIPG